jgi:hypothetical protein
MSFREEDKKDILGLEMSALFPIIVLFFQRYLWLHDQHTEFFKSHSLGGGFFFLCYNLFHEES